VSHAASFVRPVKRRSLNSRRIRSKPRTVIQVTSPPLGGRQPTTIFLSVEDTGKFLTSPAVAITCLRQVNTKIPSSKLVIFTVAQQTRLNVLREFLYALPTSRNRSGIGREVVQNRVALKRPRRPSFSILSPRRHFCWLKVKTAILS